MQIELTQEHLNVIGAGLQELAYKHAAPVIAHIMEQVKAANKAAETAPTSSVDFTHDPG